MVAVNGQHMRQCMAAYDHKKLLDALADLKDLYKWAIRPKMLNDNDK